jgi:NADP-dependent 3-hydroxy acid dehydrogenase YdfG
MDGITVITDVDTKLGCSVLNTFLEHGEKVVGISSVKKSELAGNGTGGSELFEWNRCSPIDSRSVVVEILTKYKRIDEVIIVQSLQPEAVRLEETDSALINKKIDYWIKGNLYLTREFLRLFSERKSGSLVFVNHFEGDAKNLLPLSEVIRSAYTGLISSLLPLNSAENVRINGIESKSVFPEELADFIYKNTIERFRKTSGKLLPYHDQKGLFDRLKKG